MFVIKRNIINNNEYIIKYFLVDNWLKRINENQNQYMCEYLIFYSYTILIIYLLL